EVSGQNRERSPGARQPEAVVEQPAEELQVVGGGDEGAEGDEGQQPEVVRDRDRNSDRTRPGKRAGRERAEDNGRNPRLQRASIQLVERMRADAEAEEE